MTLVTDPAQVDTTPLPSGQQTSYLVLSDEERAKGFVRPVRTRYIHIGAQSKYPLRALTAEETERYAKFNYVAYEEYPESQSPVCGRFWTQEQLDARKCNGVTTMGQALAETYARDPKFYGGTFCCKCGGHYPVAEFVWDDESRAVLGT